MYIIATSLYQIVYQVIVTKTMELIRLLVLWGGSGTQKKQVWPIFSPFQVIWNNFDFFTFDEKFGKAPLFWGGGGGQHSKNYFQPIF